MLRQAIAFFGFVALVACSNPSVEIASNGPAPVVLYEGARLIAGDGSAPMVDSAFLVESGTITTVGRKGDVTAPAGAGRVDLTGKTVMPTLINAHGHPGFQRGLTYSADNFTRENIIDDLNRALYFGVAVVQSQGIEKGDVTYRDSRRPGSRKAGRRAPAHRRPRHRRAERGAGRRRLRRDRV